MNIVPFAFQSFLFLLLVVSASAATFRTRALAALSAVFPQSGMGRFGTAIFLWLVTIATLASSAVPFVAFFAACLSLVAALLIGWRGLGAKHKRLLTLPVFMAATAVAVAIAQPLGLKVLALPK